MTATEPPEVADPYERLAAVVEHRNAQHWHTRAACTGLPLSLFFAGRSDKWTPGGALAVCARCPVRAECLAANLDAVDGIVGGTTPKQRRRLRRGDAA